MKIVKHKTDVHKQKRNKKSAPENLTFDQARLKQDIIYEAKVLGLAESLSETIAESVAAKVAIWVEKRAAITMEDLNRRVAMELMKYNADLAYVYSNRGKII